MLEQLERILVANEYGVKQVELMDFDARIAMPRDLGNKQEYFLILAHQHLSDELVNELLMEHTATFLDTLAAMPYVDESLRKNCTLLLCCENGRLSNQLILQFEENPFSFKKNVISYTADELTAFTKIIEDNEPNNLFLNRLLNAEEGELFAKFKNGNLDEKHYYPLLLRLMTKVPLLTYTPNQQELDDLEAVVRDSLTMKEQKVMDYLLNIDLSTDKENEVKESLLGNWEIVDE